MATGAQASKAEEQANRELSLYNKLRQLIAADARRQNAAAAAEEEDPASNTAPQAAEGETSNSVHTTLKELEQQLKVRHKGSRNHSFLISVKHFLRNTTTLSGKPRGDYYVMTFIVQFITLITLGFGWAAFEGDTTGADSAATQSTIPVTMLIFLLFQFAVMILDRVFYLTRNMKGKLVLHYLLLAAIHFYAFFALPIDTDRSFPSNGVIIFIYVLYCTYWLLSSHQVT